MHVLEALQKKYDVTLVTFTDPNLQEQNEHYKTNVNNIHTDQVGSFGPIVRRSLEISKMISGIQLGRLHAAVFDRLVRSWLVENFDLTFATGSELTIDGPSIQYIHYPWYGREKLPEELEHLSQWERLHDRLCESISGHEYSNISSKNIITNSDWTGEVVEQIYGISPKTIYPPVKTDDLYEVSWKERENGFVCIGRITPSKNIHRNIKIIDRLREKGHNVHLHIIGPISNGNYSQKICDLAEDRSYISLEGKVSRDRLVDLVCTHRYGIHGMENEHFGIAVAELVAAGTIPFVPNSGGQQEIVNREEQIIYDSVPSAMKKIDIVLSESDIQKSIKKGLPEIDEQFGPDRFKKKIRDVVAETLHD
ncbi:group 1 glycosyl transferase [Natrinema altunense JCM 12890]|uniref:Group 1 glycosyl transferase n=2 Tax=Natrinema altunense TaxID=222984 RepID=L9ZNF9_NATA2|nr:group 1 glycosyl transferase [Natrinema altunense JCM 12890]